MLEIVALEENGALWERVADYAENCSWSAGKTLAKAMRERAFSAPERVFAALDGGSIAGFCNLIKTDCVPNVSYTPFIGYVFVDERFRGQRLSERMINFAARRAKECGFAEVYLVSDHVGLYEKYGFTEIDRKPAFWGDMQSIYVRST